MASRCWLLDSNLSDLCEKAGLRAKEIVRIEPSGLNSSHNGLRCWRLCSCWEV